MKEVKYFEMLYEEKLRIIIKNIKEAGKQGEKKVDFIG